MIHVVKRLLKVKIDS